MSKLAKQYYLNAKGEKKVNCYKVNISKEILKCTDIKENDEIVIYPLNGKIIIAKASNLFVKNQI